MANLSPKFYAKEYAPGGMINYIYDIGNQIATWDTQETQVLFSNGYSGDYPSTYCNNLVYGGTETLVDEEIKYRVADYSDPLYQNPFVYNDNVVNLAYPLQAMFNGGATKITSGSQFGQAAGDDVAAQVICEVNSNQTTSVKWYKNGTNVHTDTLEHPVTSFALAIAKSGATITGYSYIFSVVFVESAHEHKNKLVLFTSGLKSNADVLGILNEGGYAGGNDTVYGFEDAELGEFIISKITSASGTDIYTGTVCGGEQDATIASCNKDLSTICENYGWLGTDVVCYLAGTKDSGVAWDFFNNDPAAEGKYVDIPVEGGYNPRRIIYTGGDFYVQELDGGGNVLSSSLIQVNGNYRTAGSGIYVTWYKQTDSIANMTTFCTVSMMRTSGSWQKPYYRIYQHGIFKLDVEPIDTTELFEGVVDGYDPESGQEDDPQDEPEDIDDPTYDPLGSGFLYAFAVDENDMTNLAECLVPETLAEKIRADFGNSLFEFIVSYHMMPCLTNASSLNKMAIAYRGNPFKYGVSETQLQLAPITKTFYTISCGTKICMPTNARFDGFENWAQANVQLYLPFIGYIHLNTADVWNKSITVSYKFDILQGTCVANIGVGGNGTIYSYEGTCKYSIPFTTAIDHSNASIMSGIMSSATAAVTIGGVAAGGSPMSLLSAAGSIADAAGGFISAAEHKSTINRGGCLSGAPGWLMPRKPALIITIPDRIEPGLIYNNTNGYPTFQTGYLSGWTGNYIEVGQIDLKAVSNAYGANPNDSELDMIKSTLKGGVYV